MILMERLGAADAQGGSMPFRPPILAGTFYSADPAQLAGSVDSHLKAGEEAARAGGHEAVPASMAVLPHAGHVYCGRVIGETLARIRLPDRLIIVCPSHTGKGAPLSVWPEGEWGTPLGGVSVDAALARDLIATDAGYTADTRAHTGEHSIEVLLPFIQRAMPGVRIVPVVVATHPDGLQAAGQGLASVLRKASADGSPAGLIVSSDLHHYGNEPVTRAQDEVALNLLVARDPVALYNTVVGRHISMCGIQPAALALFAGRELGWNRVELVAHTTSAEASGDTSRVVGYAGLFAV